MDMAAHVVPALAEPAPRPRREEKPRRMDRTERFYKIDQMLQSRGRVKVREFLDELGISLATFKRDLEYMRSRLNAPIVWDRDQEAYRFEEGRAGKGPRYELPGLWFSPSEAQALLTLEHLVEGLEPALLGAHVKPLKARLAALLSVGDRSAEEVRKRIRVIPFGARRHEPRHFELIASAVLGRQRLTLVYWNRTKDETTTREVSPQRLVLYREQLVPGRVGPPAQRPAHLRARCDARGLDGAGEGARGPRRGARCGARERVRDLLGEEGAVGDVAIHAGAGAVCGDGGVASEAAGRWEKDGSYVLEVPYSSEAELLMDVLKFGADVEVGAPSALRVEVRERLAIALRIMRAYRQNPRTPRPRQNKASRRSSEHRFARRHFVQPWVRSPKSATGIDFTAPRISLAR